MLAIELDIVPNRDDPTEDAGAAGSGETPIKLDIVPTLADTDDGDAPVPITIPEEPTAHVKEANTAGFFTRRKLALGFSLALHVSAAATFLFLKGQDVQIAGGAQEEVIIWGTDLVELAAAGAPTEIIEPVTEPTISEPAAVEPVEPVQERVQPVETANIAPEEMPATPPSEAAPIEPAPSPPEPSEETPVEAQPVQPAEILAAPATPEPNMTEPVPAPAEPIEPVEETPPKEKAVATAPVPRPTPRPNYQPPKSEPKETPEEPKQRTARSVERSEQKAENAAPQRKAEKAGGSGGRDTRDAKRGSSEGRQAANGAASRGAGRASQAGNAAVSNYPGKVVSKLRRSRRYPREAQRQRLTGEVRVAFTVSSNGSVSGIRIVRSSGSPVLDQAAVATVQRAAPFPKIPADAGRSSWPFTVPLEFKR